MEIRKRIAIAGCLAGVTLLTAPVLAACGAGSENGDHRGYVKAPAGAGNAPNEKKVQTPDTKGGNNVGGNNGGGGTGSRGFAEGFARGGSK